MMNDFFRAPDYKRQSSEHIRGHVEKQSDGTLLYKVVFDVHGYGPEDLKTSLIADRTVQVAGRANIEDQTTGKQTTMSFEEQFNLPENVDSSMLRSVVTNSQLIISAPLLPPQYPSIKSPKHQHFHSNSKSTSSNSPTAQYSTFMPLSPQHQHQQQHQQHQQQQHQQQGLKKLTSFVLEVDIGKEFMASDMKIVTADNGSRLIIHGQRQVKSAGKSSFREFRDEFDLPTSLDLARMTARLRSDGKILVEAPLKPETEPGMELVTLPVQHQ